MTQEFGYGRQIAREHLRIQPARVYPVDGAKPPLEFIHVKRKDTADSVHHRVYFRVRSHRPRKRLDGGGDRGGGGLFGGPGEVGY